MKSSNILDEITNNWMLYAVIFLITSHLLMAVLIVANPVNQDLEGLFGMPDSKSMFYFCIIPIIQGRIFHMPFLKSAITNTRL